MRGGGKKIVIKEKKKTRKKKKEKIKGKKKKKKRLRQNILGAPSTRRMPMRSTKASLSSPLGANSSNKQTVTR